MTGLELLKAPGTTAGEIADIISEHCPPVCPAECDRLSCRECWLSWLTTGEPPKAAGPSDKQTAPDEEGLHPNIVERLRQQTQEYKKQTLWEVMVDKFAKSTFPQYPANAMIQVGRYAGKEVSPANIRAIMFTTQK